MTTTHCAVTGNKAKLQMKQRLCDLTCVDEKKKKVLKLYWKQNDAINDYTILFYYVI